MTADSITITTRRTNTTDVATPAPIQTYVNWMDTSNKICKKIEGEN